MESQRPDAAERPSPDPATPRVRRRPRWGRIALGLSIVAAFLLGCGLFIRSLMPTSTLMVRKVGGRPAEGIVLLAVAQGSANVRREWPVGPLRPFEAQEIELGFVSDTDLAIRFRTAEGSVLEDRLRIYLGSSSKQSIRVDIGPDGVKQAYARRPIARGGDEPIRFSRGLEPVAPGVAPEGKPR